EFNLNKTIEVLECTPSVLKKLLSGLSDAWVLNNEGKDTWSPFDVVGHLIHGEKTDWIPRMEIILSAKSNKKFVPFDRFAQLKNSKNKKLNHLLKEFKQLRKENIKILKSKKLTKKDLDKTGIHPEFGRVTLEQLLATWAAHDLAHIGQISRVMAKQYKSAVGPWAKYLPVMNK
ncbi:MAG TPA: DinB family protein, partial [Bacteroidia bacterium]|nr:DinB family protein [Bacteroidia bacterium]